MWPMESMVPCVDASLNDSIARSVINQSYLSRIDFITLSSKLLQSQWIVRFACNGSITLHAESGNGRR